MMWALLLRIVGNGATGHGAVSDAENTLHAYEAWLAKETEPSEPEVSYELLFGQYPLGFVQIEAWPSEVWPRAKDPQEGPTDAPEIKVTRTLTGISDEHLRELVRRAYRDPNTPVSCALVRHRAGARKTYVKIDHAYITKYERLAGVTERFTLKPLHVGREEDVPT